MITRSFFVAHTTRHQNHEDDRPQPSEVEGAEEDTDAETFARTQRMFQFIFEMERLETAFPGRAYTGRSLRNVTHEMTNMRW